MIDQAFKAVKWQGRLVANQKPVDFFPKPIFLYEADAAIAQWANS